ncbi:MAG: DUF1015 domain-containing protein [Vampirovibrionales bacterium]|nr:DUF1015 domain-containing protein [Vampirovibrionales bacterium]
MPENETLVFPFHGLRYKDVALESVTAPPYDVIDQSMQDWLYAQHPHNVVRLELNAVTPDDSIGDNAYTRASAHFRHWQDEGILQPEEAPAMYAYTQSWREKGENDKPVGQIIERKGIWTLLALEPYETRRVLPHEHTLKGPKLDRMNLMKTTLGNFSPIFMIYADPKQELETSLKGVEASLKWQQAIDQDQVTHKIAPITDNALLEKIQAVLKEQRLLIADGHHRYETALAFKAEARARYRQLHGKEAPEGSLLSDYLMVFVSNLHDPGLKVYPTDRVLHHWPEGFSQDSFEKALFSSFNQVTSGEDFTYQANGKAPCKLKLKDKASLGDLHPDLHQLDTAILEEAVFKGIFKAAGEQLKASHTLGFYRNPKQVEKLLKHGDAVAVFYMATPPVSLIKEVCEAGHRMPQKSTYFYPKLLSGLVFYSYAPFAQKTGIAHALTDVSLKAAAPIETLPIGAFSLEKDGLDYQLALVPD